MGSDTEHAPTERGGTKRLENDVPLCAHFLVAVTGCRAVPTFSIALLGLRVAARSTHPDLLYCDYILQVRKALNIRSSRSQEWKNAGTCRVVIFDNIFKSTDVFCIFAPTSQSVRIPREERKRFRCVRRLQLKATVNNTPFC